MTFSFKTVFKKYIVVVNATYDNVNSQDIIWEVDGNRVRWFGDYWLCKFIQGHGSNRDIK